MLLRRRAPVKSPIQAIAYTKGNIYNTERYLRIYDLCVAAVYLLFYLDIWMKIE
jgi:hypothetical protein